MELKKKLAEQQAHLKQLENHMYVTETQAHQHSPHNPQNSTHPFTYPRATMMQAGELTLFPFPQCAVTRSPRTRAASTTEAEAWITSCKETQSSFAWLELEERDRIKTAMTVETESVLSAMSGSRNNRAA